MHGWLRDDDAYCELSAPKVNPASLSTLAALDLQRRRSVLGLIGTALFLYARYLPLFASLALVVVLPVDLILYGVAAQQLWSGYDDNLSPAIEVANFVVPLLVLVPLISGNHARAVIALGEGRVPALMATVNTGLRLFPALAFVVVLYDVGSFAGFIFFILPGIYLYVRWFVCVQVAAVEQLRGKRALKRSGALVENNWWRVFCLAIIFWFLARLASSAIYIALDELAKQADSGLLSFSGLVLTDALVYSFTALGATLLYFDLCYRAKHRQDG